MKTSTHAFTQGIPAVEQLVEEYCDEHGIKNYYMACLDLEGRRCLVVGGGSVGLEKASGLIASGARVTVVSPELHEASAPHCQEIA